VVVSVARKPYDSEEARTAELLPFLDYYNHERPHASLKHQPPVSRVPGKDFRLTDRPLEPS
jgi:hypothetical protein